MTAPICANPGCTNTTSWDRHYHVWLKYCCRDCYNQHHGRVEKPRSRTIGCLGAQELEARRFLAALKHFGCEVVRQGKRPDITAFMQEWRRCQ